MKHTITMEYRSILYIALIALLALCGVGNIQARSFTAGDIIYLEARQDRNSDFDWSIDDASLLLYLWKDGGGYNEWIEFHDKVYEHNDNKHRIYKATISTTREYDRCIVVRRPASDWSHSFDGKWNQTGDMEIHGNFLRLFKQDETYSEWDDFFYGLSDPTGNPATMNGIDREQINVCQQAIDSADCFSLMPLFNDAKDGYNTPAPPVWLHWNGSKWVICADGNDAWVEDMSTHLTGVINDSYYILCAPYGEDAKRRFIHLHKEPCTLNCEITSFEYVTTPVNVSDSTFAIEGLVAFTKVAGSLKVSYGDGEGAPYDLIDAPVSPQTFSIKNIKADGSTKTLYARFLGSGGDTKSIAGVTAPTPTTGIDDEGTRSLLHNTAFVQTVATPEFAFKWMDGRGNVLKEGVAGGDNNINYNPAYGFDTTVVYYYNEYNIPPEAENNMMKNGSYETSPEDFDYPATSEYEYTGLWDNSDATHKDVYDNGYRLRDSLFGVTTNAHVFWRKMAHIAPHEGTKLAVFDGDHDQRVAWEAKTATDDKLKLQKGTTYLFSFWVANVNNYGEMINKGTKNNAILQFQIKYTDTDGIEHGPTFLGTATDLNDVKYFNNFWHQNSATFTSDYDANDVTISVVDKNANPIKIGNDFALDDIRFRAISVESGTIREQKKYTVKFEEPAPEVKDVTVEPITYPACGQDTFSLKVRFAYKTNTPHTIDLNIGVSGFAGAVTKTATLANTAGAWETQEFIFSTNTSTDPAVTTNSLIRANGGSMKATVNVSVTDVKSVTRSAEVASSACGIPATPVLATKEGHGLTSIACGSTTYSIAVKTSYTYFHGDYVYVSLDGAEKTALKAAIDKRNTSATDYETTLSDLPADGAMHTLRVYSDNALDCYSQINVTAPKGNTVSTFAVAPIQPNCDVETYNLRATWTVAKPDGGMYDNIIIKIGDAVYERSATEGTYDIPITYTIGDAHPTIKAYMKERGESCYFTPLPTYADPVTPRMTIGNPWSEDIACNVPTFTLVVPDTFIYQRGDMRMWLDSATYDKAKSGQKITITDGNRCAGVTTGDKYTVNSTDKLVTLFKFTGLSLTGTHKIFAECTGEHSCHRVPEDYAGKEFVAPTLPTAAVKEGSIEYTSPVCDVEMVTLKFTIDYVNQSGTLKVWVADLGEETYSYAGTTGSVNIEYPNVPADGLATRKLNFEFEGSCSVINIALPAPPRWPVVKGVTVTTPANVACSEDDYTASIKVDYVNIASADKLVVQYTNAAGETKTKKMDEVSLTGTSKTFDFTLDDIDKGSKELYVYLDGAAADCKTTLQHKGTYTAPYRPELIINSVDTLHDACSANTYAIAIDWKYRAFKAGTMKFYVDEMEKGTPRAVTYNATTFTLCKDTIKGLTADGGLHTLKLLTNVADNCTESRSNIRAPKGNTITSFRVDTTVLKCDETKYRLIASWEVPAPAGTYDTLIIVNAANEVLWKDSLTSATRSNIVTLAKEYTVGDVTTPTPIYAYLKERGRSACDKSDTYVSPVTPKLNALSTRIITDSADCDESTYSLIVPITYTNQHGRMYVWLDAASYAAATDKVEVTSSTGFVTGGAYADGVGYTEGATVSKKTYAKITGIQGNGAERKVSVAFDDPRGCKILDGLTYTEPFRPVITGVTATPTTPDAGVLTYDVEVTVSTTNGHGRQVTITSGDLGLSDFTGNVDGLTGKLTHTFEGITTDHGKTHKFYAYFTDRKNCVKEGSFTSPDQRKFHTFNVVDTLLPLCNNTSYVVFEVTSTAMGGELVIKDKDTDVELYRHATPIANLFRDTIKDLSRKADGSVHTLVASFTAPTPVQSKEDSYTARPEPTISMSGGAVTGPDCKGTVHLPLTVSFVNQTSDLYIVNNKGEEIDHVLAAELIGKSTFSAGEYHYTKDWTYEANNESATLKAYAYFSDRPDCTRPEVAAVEKHAQTWGYTYHHSAIACDGSYTDTLHFTWSNGASAFHVDSVHATTHAVQESLVNDSRTEGSATRYIRGNVVTDTPKDIYRVYWEANNTDECDSIIATIVPNASVLTFFDVTKDEVTCGATTYTFHPTWTYSKAAGDLIIAEVGKDAPLWKGAADADQSTVVITGDLDLAHPGTQHKLYAYFEDRGKGICNSSVVTVNEPLVPYVKVTRSEYTQPACYAATDTLVVDLQFVRLGGTAEVWVDGGAKTSSTASFPVQDAPQTWANIRINDVPADRLTHTLHVKFSSGCATQDIDIPVNAPATPTMVIGAPTTSSDADCQDSTYTLVVPVTYAYQLGKMYAWIDTDTKRHQVSVNEQEDGAAVDYAAGQSSRITNIKFTGLTGDGNSHTIHVACDGEGACDKSKSFDAPFRPVIDSVVVRCSQPAFGEVYYNDTVKVYYKNATKSGGADLIIQSTTPLGDEVSVRKKTTAVSGNGVLVHTFTGIRATDGASYRIEAFFDDRNTCKPYADFVTPDTRHIEFTVKPSIVDCNGNDTILFTVNAADLSGNLVITDGTNELYNKPAPASYPFTGKIDDALQAAGTNLNLQAYFTSDLTFLSGAQHYIAPDAPTLSLGRKPGHVVSCDGNVTMQLVVEYAHQTGSLEVRDNSNALIAEIANGALPASPFTIDWTYAADGEARTATAFFSNRPTCVDTEDADALSVPYRTFTHHLSTPDCDGYYYDTIRFAWKDAAGEFVVDSAGTNLCPSTAANGTFDRVLRGYVTDAERDLYAMSFSGQLGCEPTIVRSSVPASSVLTGFKIDSVYAVNCGANQYKIDLSWTYSKAVGGLVIEDATAGVLRTIALADLTSSCTITDLPIDGSVRGKQHTLYAYFQDKGKACKKELTYREPVVPATDTIKTEYASVECNVTTTTLTVDIEYIKQSGSLQVWYDTSAPQTVTYDIAKNNLDTVRVTIPNFPADGKDNHMLYVTFGGALDCQNKSYKLPRTPFSPMVSDSKVVRFENETCGSDTYSAVVTFNVTNGQSKRVVATCKGQTGELPAASEGENTIRIDGISRANPREEYEVISISFPDATDCSVQDTAHFVEPHKPQLLSIRLDDQQAEVDCKAEQYTLRGAVQFINIGDATPQLWLGDNEASAIPLTGTPEIKSDTATLTFNAITIPTDGKPFTLHLKADGKTAGCPIQEDFTAIWRQVITDVHVSVSATAVSCDEPYSATVAVDYLHGLNKRIYVAYRDSDNTARLDSSALLDVENSTALITLPKLYDTGATDKNVTVYFADYTDCAIDTAKFRLPTLNSITDVTAVCSTSTCGELNYSISGKVTFNSGVGDLVVYYDDTHRDTISSPVSPAAYSIGAMSKAGTGLQVYAYFTGADKCKQESNVFDSPSVPALDASVTKVDTLFTCGGKTYTVHLTITSDNQSGKGYVIDSIAGGALRTVATHDGTYNGDDEFTIALPEAAEQHFVIVRYPATGCEVISPAIAVNPYVKPQPRISLTPVERICDTETELLLPFTLTQGDVDKAVLTLVDYAGRTVISAADLTVNEAKDTLVYTLPTPLEAGVHTATVEVRDTLDCSFTATPLKVEVAMDGQIYSKWTDVLLVDNNDGQFRAYEWYEDGTVVGNDQVLYLPNGNVSTASYYCLITLADGRQIYTCDYAFDAIPRSADHPAEDRSANEIIVRPNRVPMGGIVSVMQSLQENLQLVLMSTTGQRIAEYAQTESSRIVDMPSVQGVYLLRIASPTDVQTVKIVVY
ncbi:MAG: T9SS type A sorting domain-containing protein [Paludibacteraceae bacterium]|nr:T9SS type A sorting domain-containing protein [Paludibacteraceae bacterium]